MALDQAALLAREFRNYRIETDRRLKALEDAAAKPPSISVPDAGEALKAKAQPTQEAGAVEAEPKG